MNYYEVVCALGHRGVTNHKEIVFVIKAKNLFEAMNMAKKMPGVKHHASYAVLGAKQISEDEYCRRRNANSAYSVCRIPK